ncbi:MAG TPA: hypothetical protein VNA19_11285, partial [Pyrinomonadaceae bacterium]|nr:hypothetical protein [Pyrinomonadaceae bacterium]
TFAGTVSAEARQSLPLAQSTSTLTSSRPAADAPQADGRSVAFEIRDGARTASRRADSSRNAASAQTFAGTVSAEARQSLPLAQSTSTLTSSRPASDAPQADVRSVAFEIQDGARAAATGAARIVWRKGREGWSPDAAASFETDASVSSAVSSASSGASGASGAAAVSPATQSQSIVPAPVSTEARNGAANIERITEQVIRTLSRRMSVERERRGLRR